MRISYVVSTMAFWGYEHPLSFEQECQFLKSLGFGIELWPYLKGQNECRYEKRNWPRLLAATKDMVVSMCSRNNHPTLKQWNEQIECAKLLKANIVADLKSLGIQNGSELDGLASEVVTLAELNKVKMCLENGSLPILRKVGERFKSIWYCLDTGQANLDRQFSFKEYVDELTPRVAHLHLTDNYGQMDDHVPPGLHGGISHENWEYLLNTLSKYDNDVIGCLEMCPCMPAVLIRQASEFLFDKLNWPNRPQKQSSYDNLTYNPT